MDKITIIQPQGLGDILFTQKIAHKLIDYGYKVYWPLGIYRWISNYMITDNLIWSECPEESHILRLNNSIESNHPYDIMTCKYNMIGNTMNFLQKELHNIDYKDWCQYFNFKRNYDKENQLFFDVLKLNEGDEYVLYNSKYGVGQINQNVTNHIEKINMRKIDLSFIDGFTLFDWCKVIENAREIHTVDTSVIYVVEKLKTNSELFLYPRHPDHTEKCLSDILNKKWNFVNG